ncbi:hypothetical protein POM88_046044 [Heracleum sosnowskyi]|uniref:Endonuclease/exonuclease/phosphatase domain-containing protein n=1 Tax=Heracleum sosnowskyi TaxID=360622 RepID=A0AAD8H8J7_9APIA|nr:hypothetical protein POM88_046044 [Heracleum sosnowskyi]
MTKRVEKVKEIIGFEGAFTVETQGHSGGLAFLWMNKKEATILSYKGYPYTWESGYGTHKWIEIRLDRALVSNSFMHQFGEAKLTNMKITTSDHSPILLEPFTSYNVVRTKQIRFENAWLRDPMCGKIVEETWQLNHGKPFIEKISITLETLAKWGKEVTGCFRNRIQQLKRVMYCTKGRKDEYSVKLYQDSSSKLMEVYSEQEVFWR